MPKYRVPVTIIAKSTYVVTVEADNERLAEEQAIDQWREQVPSNFQVSDFDEAEAEAEQLTYECDDCGKEITYEEWAKGDSWCLECVYKEVQ